MTQVEQMSVETRQKLQAYNDYIKQLLGEKRRHPQDDLISLLVQIEEGGDRLSESELLSMIALLILAGHETTSNLKCIFAVLAGVKHTLSNRSPSQAVAPEWIKGRRYVQKSTTKLRFSLSTSRRRHQQSTFHPGVCLTRYNLVTPDSWYHPTIPENYLWGILPEAIIVRQRGAGRFCRWSGASP